jgi:micrococcal nuclease
MKRLWRWIIALCTAALLVAACANPPDEQVRPGDATADDATADDATADDATADDATADDATADGQVEGRVSRVIDGDTLDIVVAGETRRVRLLGVDTPESVHPTEPVECYGPEASAFLRALVEGQTVRLAADPSQDAVDRYDRWLGLIWLDDGTLVNHELIAQGYATAFITRPPHARSTAFRDAEDQARAAGLGMWAADACGAGSRGDDAADAPRTAIPADAAGCPGDVSQAPNAPVAIVAIDKQRETVTILNIGVRPVDLAGWWICSIAGGQRHATLSGTLAPDEQRVIANDAGESVWSNGSSDPGVLIDQRGRVVSYWPD